MACKKGVKLRGIQTARAIPIKYVPFLKVKIRQISGFALDGFYGGIAGSILKMALAAATICSSYAPSNAPLK